MLRTMEARLPKVDAFVRRSLDRRPWLWSALLISIVVAVWSPSLRIFFQRDHWWVLYDFNERSGKLDFLWHYLSTPRTRLSPPILSGEFRPLTHLAIALQQILFGVRSWLWQSVSLLTHVLTTYLLYRWNRLFMPNPLAWLMSLFFGVAFVNADLVTWSHIVGYGLFCVFFLLFCRSVYLHMGRKRVRDAMLSGVFLGCALMCAEFPYVMLPFFVLALLLAGGVGSVRRNTKPILAGVAALLLVTLYNVIDHRIWLGTWLPAGERHLRISISPSHVLRVGEYCLRGLAKYLSLLTGPFFRRFTLAGGWWYWGRYEVPVFPEPGDLSLMSVFLLVVYAGAFFVGVCVAVHATRRLYDAWKSGREFPEAVMFLFSLMCAVGILCFVLYFRDPVFNTTRRMHQAYLVCVCLFTAAPIFLRGSTKLMRLVGATLVILIAVNGTATFTYCRWYAAQTADLRDYVSSVRGVIQAHAGEPDFKIRLPSAACCPYEKPGYAYFQDWREDRSRPFTPASLIFGPRVSADESAFQIQFLECR